jgi:NAD dependent epimerase/dehydratase family enzyme
VIGEAISRCKSPPCIWLNSSTATIYKHSFDRPMDEARGLVGATREAKDAFSVEVATAWERTFNEAEVAGTRKVTLRTAMVLSSTGSVFLVLRRLIRLGLGGKMANGKQYVSWIHELDFC